MNDKPLRPPTSDLPTGLVEIRDPSRPGAVFRVEAYVLRNWIRTAFGSLRSSQRYQCVGFTADLKRAAELGEEADRCEALMDFLAGEEHA